MSDEGGGGGGEVCGSGRDSGSGSGSGNSNPHPHAHLHLQPQPQPHVPEASSMITPPRHSIPSMSVLEAGICPDGCRYSRGPFHSRLHHALRCSTVAL
ncbi:hypothetical protein BO70DRAFT_357843 [Aspergillus heteromorphus CBS 117.55]|uniref:Uncharacterized protein n=1 Tax=Aspergillus heteromorphus CBS 117.55 TaxID=1448321 RepID=A0A317X2C0_9EURO|nr:uncharacterized protein BO70DRAFT_357843 [Aspergillus heteromorphus CBS 117.55]PWY92703.1 hypothetical protein BO70DRAFT_357843 [Aspergillus heteromorphus CBS 117.55]